MQFTGTRSDADAAILARAAAWQPHVTLDELDAEVLCDVAAEYDLDFATAVLYDRAIASLRFAATRAMLEGLDSCDFEETSKPSLIAIVPGAFYRESPQTGADGNDIRLAAARLGVPCEVVPLRSFGNLAENSQLIGEWLAGRRETSIVLFSLSKGGAEVKHAMAQSPDAFNSVIAWVNLSGILERSPLAQWLLNQPLRSLVIRLWFWWRGYDFRVVHEYATRSIAEWCIPPHVRAIHVVGFPLEHHLSTPLAERGRRRLAALGPNDSAGNVLAEAIGRPGIVVPLWGADHYLRPAGVDPLQLVQRLLAVACRPAPAMSPDAAVAGASR